MSLRTQLENGESNYSIYFGPNDYNDLKSYDLGYENILPLGFMWIDTIVNKYIIIKLFNFLKNSNKRIRKFWNNYIIINFNYQIFISAFYL